MSYYYVCDNCGSFVTITDAPIPEDEAWSCAECNAERMWEFTNKANALAHASHIADINRSGLFRSAS